MAELTVYGVTRTGKTQVFSSIQELTYQSDRYTPADSLQLTVLDPIVEQVVSEKKNRIIYYRPVWEREAYQKEQTETLINRLYHGSAKELAVSLFQGGNMTKEDLEDIRKMFDL